MRSACKKLVAAALVSIFVVAGWSGAALAVDPPRWVAAMYMEAQGQVGLRWQPVPEATGYVVLRSTTRGSGYQKIADASQPQYFDATVTPGTVYYYTLQALAGSESSANAEERSVTIPAKAARTAPPQWRQATMNQDAGGIRLEWQAVPGAVAYNIFRRESFKPQGKEDLLASVPNAEPYLDKKDLKGAVEYVYSLTVLDGAFVESDKSAESKVQFVPKVEVKAATKEQKVVAGRKTEPLGIFTYVPSESDAPGTVKAGIIGYHDGSVYVSFSNQKIQVFSEKGALKSEFVSGTDTDAGKAIPRTPGDIQFDTDGNMYLSGFGEGKISKFSSRGALIGIIDLNASNDPTQPLDKVPVKINRFTIGTDGRIYVSDIGNSALKIFDATGKILTRAGGRGVFAVPACLYVTKEGNVVMLEAISSQIRILDKDMKTIVTFGSPGSREGQIGRPSGMVVNEQKRLVYIADMINSVIHIFTFEGKVAGTIKYYDQKEERLFNQPTNMAITEDGTIFVIEYALSNIMALKDLFE